MTRRKSAPSNLTEDVSALSYAHTDAYATYAAALPPVRVTDLLLNHFNGSTSDLAMELADSTDKKSTAYKSQLRSINRWLAYESGNKDKKQSRNPTGKKTQAKLKAIVASKEPPTKMEIKLTGWIYYDEDARWRSISASLDGDALTRYLEAMQEGDTHDAYREVFRAYGASALMIGGEDAKVEIDLS